MRGSFWRRLPAAALRGFGEQPRLGFALAPVELLEAASGMNTSPRTSSSAGDALALQALRDRSIVRTFAVTSSPVDAVAACRGRATSRPSS